MPVYEHFNGIRNKWKIDIKGFAYPDIISSCPE
jgi:hypothetical protein